MIASLIGTGLTLASSIYGAAKSKQAADKAQEQLNKQQRQNEEWYRNRKNEDYMQTTAAQSVLSANREQAQQLMANARGANAVMGGTGASIAQAQQAIADQTAKTIAGLGATDQARKDAAESQYLATRSALGQQQMNIYNQQSANIANAASTGIAAGLQMAGADAKSMLDRGKGLWGDYVTTDKDGNKTYGMLGKTWNGKNTTTA